MHSIYNFISNLHSYNANASNSLPTSLQIHVLAIEGPSHPIPVAPYTKAQSLTDILHQLGPITNVSYTPFQPEWPSQLARVLLFLLFPQKPRLFDYFILFFMYDLF
jgi:hypothetical protein